MKHFMDIKNDVQRNATAMRMAGSSNLQIRRVVADIIKHRGPIGTGRYSCSCNGWGPRWIENSLNGCCPGCFQWALDHHQDMSVNGVVPPTVKMVEDGQSHGINIKKLKEILAIKAHEAIHVAVKNCRQTPTTWDLEN